MKQVDSTKATVLFVDDEPRVLDAFRRSLKKEPYELLFATDPTQALSLLSGIKVDVIVSDQKMPHMSGTTLLSLVRTNYPDTVRIMLTGEGDLNTAIKAINDGEIYRFFTKPCNEIDLGIAIRQGLAHRALLEQARKMLEVMKMQSAYIANLETDHPGISRVKREEDGRLLIDDVQQSLEELLVEVECQLSLAEQGGYVLKS